MDLIIPTWTIEVRLGNQPPVSYICAYLKFLGYTTLYVVICKIFCRESLKLLEIIIHFAILRINEKEN